MTGPYPTWLSQPEKMPVLMGVLNVTPDSFSDGGAYPTPEMAAERGLAMARAGAGIIDVGGESTRPGSERVRPDEQCRRVVEPIARLRAALDDQGMQRVRISIDTTRAAVAEAAVDAGAAMLNDVSAGREDPGMLSLAAERGLPIALMHMQGQPGTMQQAPRYDHVVEEVLGFLLQRAEAALQAGVPRERLWLDPGIGFGKSLAHNLALLGALDRLVATGYPVLLGVSRKRFIAGCCGLDSDALPPTARVPGSLAAGLLGAQAGVRVLRVHDVAEHAQALAVFAGVKLNTSQTK